MTAPRYIAPPTDPHARLRELREDTAVSPEIADLRLAILRQEFPEAVVQIDVARADDIAIAVKATIGLPGGGRHSAVAAADVDDQESWADQLEMVQAVAVARALDGLQHRSRPNAAVQAPQPRRQPQPQPAGEPTPADADHLPEYSWNAFWQTMNTRNITREQVEQALGKTVQEATPKEAVDALKAAGLLT